MKGVQIWCGLLWPVYPSRWQVMCRALLHSVLQPNSCVPKVKRQLISIITFKYSLGKSAFHVILCCKGANHSKMAMRTCIKHAACNVHRHGSEPSKHSKSGWAYMERQTHIHVWSGWRSEYDCWQCWSHHLQQTEVQQCQRKVGSTTIFEETNGKVRWGAYTAPATFPEGWQGFLIIDHCLRWDMGLSLHSWKQARQYGVATVKFVST